MGKPFSLQSPEQVAKEYGGNKQKIAQAAQMGQVDPTAAVLAGMFIDRMRSAQSLEQGAQPTVAQQVLAPPAPASAPAAPPASGAPPMGMAPPMAPQAPPMGMASGGLTTLPIPDDMFDEPQYGGGGIVAFAEAGEVESDLMRLARIVSDPDASPEARNAAQKELVSRRPPEAPTPLGRIGSSIYDYFYQTPEALAVARAKLEGPDLLRKEADELAAASTLFSTVSSADRANNLEEADRLREKANAIERGEPTSTTSAPAAPAAYDPYSPATQAELTGLGGLAIDPRRAAQLEVASAPAEALPAGVLASPELEAMAPPPREERVGTRGPARAPAPRVDQEVTKAVADVAEAAPGVPKIDYLEALARYRGEAPTLTAGESLADQKKQDFWSTIAQMGFGAAAGTSPNALANFSAGAAGAMPGMQKAMDRRRETQRDAAKAEDARKLAIFVSKGEDFRASDAARRGDETLGLNREQLKQTAEQNKAENLLRGQQINVSAAGVAAQGSTESERMFNIFSRMKPGPEKDRVIADWKDTKGAGAIQYDPLKAQTQAQFDLDKKTIESLEGALRAGRQLTPEELNSLTAARQRVYGPNAAAVAPAGGTSLVDKYAPRGG